VAFEKVVLRPLSESPALPAGGQHTPKLRARPWLGGRLWVFDGDEPTLLLRMLLAPAVEYDIPDAGKRRLNTAVCAAFYDTGVAFAREVAQPGTRVHVRYRYTGYPAAEAEALFRQSKVYDSFMLDPEHHSGGPPCSTGPCRTRRSPEWVKPGSRFSPAFFRPGLPRQAQEET
jgi:hypothetical protein